MYVLYLSVLSLVQTTFPLVYAFHETTVSCVWRIVYGMLWNCIFTLCSSIYFDTQMTTGSMLHTRNDSQVVSEWLVDCKYSFLMFESPKCPMVYSICLNYCCLLRTILLCSSSLCSVCWDFCTLQGETVYVHAMPITTVDSTIRQELMYILHSVWSLHRNDVVAHLLKDVCISRSAVWYQSFYTLPSFTYRTLPSPCTAHLLRTLHSHLCT